MRQNLKRVMAVVLAAAMTTTSIPTSVFASDDYYAEAESDQEALQAEQEAAEEAARAAEEEAARAAEEEAARAAEEEAQRAAEEEAARAAEEEAARAAEEEAARAAEEEAARAAEEAAAGAAEEEAQQAAGGETEEAAQSGEVSEEEAEDEERIGGEFVVTLGNYLITVTTADEALPSGVELVASFIEDYGAVNEALADTFAVDAQAFDENHDYDVFKVSFIRDGEEVKPEGLVTVDVLVNAVPDDAADDSLYLSSLSTDEQGSAKVDQITDVFAVQQSAGFVLDSLDELAVSWESGLVKYTAETDKYQVVVKAPANALPADAELRVEELKEETPEYDAAKDALIEDDDEIETVEEFDEKYGFAALDAAFFVYDEEVKPEGDVRVSVTMKELPEEVTAEQLAETMAVTSLKEKEDGTVKVETVASVEEGGNEVVEKLDDPEEVEIKDGTIQVAEEVAVAYFDVDEVSTIALQWETITTKYIAADGETYSITVAYGPEAKIPKDAKLSVSELQKENEEFADYLAKSLEALGLEENAAVNARMFDISIVDSEDTEVEPQAAVQVEIRLLKEDSENGEQAEAEESLIEEEAQTEETGNEDGESQPENTENEEASAEQSESLSVVHFGDQTEVLSIETADEGGEQIISFETESFSVYTIIASGADYDFSNLNGKSFKIAMIRGENDEIYMMANKEGDHHLQAIDYDWAINDAQVWTFTQQSDGGYYITPQNDPNRYLNINRTGATGDRNNMDLEVTENPQVLYVLTDQEHAGFVQIRNENGFNDYSEAISIYNWNPLQFGCWNGEDTNNNQWLSLVSDTTNGDTVQLKGPYALVLTDTFNNTRWALKDERVDNDRNPQDRIQAQEVVFSNNNHTVETANSNEELTLWTFEPVEGVRNGYYMVSQNGKYIKSVGQNGDDAGKGLTLVADKNDATIVYPHYATFGRPGQLRIGNRAAGGEAGFFDLIGGDPNNGFGVWNSNTGAEYFTFYTVEEGAQFQAEKISAQQISRDYLPEEDRKIKTDENDRYYVDVDDIVIYKSVFIPEDNAYEDYMIDGEGNLKKVYDKGSSIAGTSDSPWWTVRIYYADAEGTTPTGYYEMYNPATGKYLDPRKEGIVLGEEYVGLMMQEKDSEVSPKTSTTIEAWDEANEANYGLYIEDVNGSVNLRSGTRTDKKSQEFSFARKYVDNPDELHEVATVDSSRLIKINMYDFKDQGAVASVLGGDVYIGGNHYNNSGIASMKLGDDGWPTFNGQSAGNLYNGDTYVGDANHLFLQDVYTNTEFYEYSSFNNYAFYNKDTGNFTVYQEIGAAEEADHYYHKRGNFFPYNPISPVPLGEGDWYRPINSNDNYFDGSGNKLDYSDPRYGETLYYPQNTCYSNDDGNTWISSVTGKETTHDRINWWFGMTMECDFAMPVDGQWNGGDMIYEFNGDDDLWIYIDGVKVLDIGGNHDALPGTINFHTGKITYGSNFAGDQQHDAVPTTIKACFQSQGIFPDGTAWDDSKVDDYFNGDTFADYTGHSLKMIYAEQGGHASNLYMRFNLPTIPEGSFTVEKQLDDAMKDVYGDREFEYIAFVRGNPNPVVYGTPDTKVKTNEIIPLGDDGKPIYDETSQFFTDYSVREAVLVKRDGTVEPLDIDPDTGIFKLKAGEKAQFSLANPTWTYDVVEVNVPDDVEKTTVNGKDAAPVDGDNWNPEDGTYLSTEEDGINLENIINKGEESYNNRYAPAGESTPRKRAQAIFMNKMTPAPLEIEKEISHGKGLEDDRFYFRLWLENQDGSISPASNAEYFLYEKDGNNWKLVRSDVYTTGNVGTLQLKAGQKAVFTGLLEGTGYVVIEENPLLEEYRFDSIASENVGDEDFDWYAFVDNAETNGWAIYGANVIKDANTGKEAIAYGTVKKVEGEYNPGKDVYTRVICNNRDDVTVTIKKVDEEGNEIGSEKDENPALFLVKKATKEYYVYDDEKVLEPKTDETGNVIPWQSIVYDDYVNVMNTPGKEYGDEEKDGWIRINGNLEIEDVVSGVYSILEKEAPKGYVISREDPVYVKISSKGNPYISLLDVDGSDITSDIDDYKVDQEVDKETGDVNVTVTITDVEDNPPTKTEKSAAGNDAIDNPTVKEGEAAEGKADLEIYQAVKPGDEIVYEIKAKNFKQYAADIKITDVLDEHVELVYADTTTTGEGLTFNYDEGTRTITWTFAKVPKTTEKTVKVAVKVLDSALEAGKVDNQALVKVANEPEVWTNEEENPVIQPQKKETTINAASGPAAPSAVLQTVLEGKATEGGTDREIYQAVKPGNTITYKISYENPYSDFATIKVKDRLDPNVSVSEPRDISDETEPKLIEEDGVQYVVWTIKNVPGRDPDNPNANKGEVFLTVVVLESAKWENGIVDGTPGPQKVDNQAFVSVGLQSAYDAEVEPEDFDPPIPTNEEENPVPITPKKEEVTVAGEPAELKGSEPISAEPEEDADKKNLETYQAVKPGDEITYSIYYQNPYDETTATITVTDELDPNVVFVKASNGTYGDTDIDSPDEGEKGTVIWTISNVPAGSVGSVMLTVKVLESALITEDNPEAPGKVDNQALVEVGNDFSEWTNKEENPVTEPKKEEVEEGEDGEYTALTPKDTVPNEEDGYDTEIFHAVKPGDVITYRISYENYNSGLATVKVRDTLDQNVELVYPEDTDPEANPRIETKTVPVTNGPGETKMVTWTIKDVPGRDSEGSRGFVTLKVRVTENALLPAGPGKVDNQAFVSVGVQNETGVEAEPDSFDPEIPTNEEENPVTEPKKEETEAADNPAVDPKTQKGEASEGGMDLEVYQAVKPGDKITYKISYENYNSTEATVKIKDRLDPNVELVVPDPEGLPTAEGVNPKIEIVPEDGTDYLIWTISKVPARGQEGSSGEVSLTVKVLDRALQPEGPGKVDNQAFVSVGVNNGSGVEYDPEIPTNEEENPVVEPKKEETEISGKGSTGKDFVRPLTEPEETLPGEATEGNADREVFPAVKPGDRITYKISYENYNQGPATVKITDNLDQNVGFVSATNGTTGITESMAGPAVGKSGMLTWTITDVPGRNHKEGESNTGYVTVTVEVLESALQSAQPAGPGKVDNQANVEVGINNNGKVEYDPPVPTNEEENPVPEPKKEETGISGKDVDRTPSKPEIIDNGAAQGGKDLEIYPAVKPGDEITYTITYKNYKQKLGTVVIRDELDPNVSFVEATVGTTGYTKQPIVAPAVGKNGTVIWTILNVPGVEDTTGEGADPKANEGTVTLTVKVLDSAKEVSRVDNQAFVKVGVQNKADEEAKDYDPEIPTNEEENPVPNPKKEETFVNNDPAEQKGDPIPHEGEGYDTEIFQAVKPGDEITYKISYENYKQKLGTVVITDVLDPNVSFVEATVGTTGDTKQPIDAPAVGATGTVTWTIKDVPGVEATKGDGADPEANKGFVTLTVKVLENAKKDERERVDNRASVSVGVQNAAGTEAEEYDPPIPTNEEENPVPNPKKEETEVNGTATTEDDVTHFETEEHPAYNTDIYQIVLPGDVITYKITYKNYMQSKATVRVTDELDPNVDLVDYSVKPDDPDARKLVWTIPDVPAGEEGTITLKVRVKDEAAGKDAGKVGNQAIVEVGIGNGSDVKYDPEIPTDDEENPVPKKDVSVREDESGEKQNNYLVKAGDILTYSIVVPNASEEMAKAVVTDKIPDNTTYYEGIGEETGGHYDPDTNTITWEIGEISKDDDGNDVVTGGIEAGKTVTVMFQVKVKENGINIKNEAGIDVKNSNDQTLYKGNTNPVENPNPIKDVGVNNTTGKGDNLKPARPGDILTYSVEVTNTENKEANIEISDRVPKFTKYVKNSAKVTKGAQYQDGKASEADPIVWKFKNVKKGATVAVTFQVEVVAQQAVVIENTADVTFKDDPGNTIKTNEVENPTPVKDVGVNNDTGKGDNQKLTKKGDILTYTVSVKNTKNETAKIEITDVVPDGTKYVESSADVLEGKEYLEDTIDDASGKTIKWPFKDVPASTTLTVVFNVEVLVDEGLIENTADVSFNDGPKVKTNTVENPIPKPKKEEVKPYEGTGTLGKVSVGDKIQYKISYWNYKKTKATVVIKDTLDKNVKFVSASNKGTCKNGVVTWTLKNVPADYHGYVTVTVEVLEGALKSSGSKVINGGDTTTVQVGDDPVFTTNTVENPVVKKQEAQLILQKRFAGEKISDEAMNNVTFTVKNAKTGKTVGTYTIGKDFKKDETTGRYTKTLTVPEGTYVVSESSNTVNGYQTSVVYVADGKSTTSSAQVAVPAGGKKTVSVTNTYKKGSGSGGSAIGGGNGASPKTGDDTPIALYVTLLALALALVIGAVVYRKKRKA